jgi:hypothetical protein
MLDHVPRRDTERDIEPYIFLTDNTESEPIMKSIIDTFTLNERQEFAFRIIANHSIGITKVGPQLLIGLFGEGGTGKSRLVNALRAWFSTNNRSNELIVTATTGSAAFNIRRSTLHSAANLTVNKRGHSRKRKMTQKKAVGWRDRNYLIIDEVSMLDLRTLENLHDQLSQAKGRLESDFGGVNIIFMGDFLQIPSVSYLDVYVYNKKWEHGCALWKRLNAVVILRDQVRQHEDPHLAEILHRARLQIPTDEDIEVLNGHIGAQLPHAITIPIIVCQHKVRETINMQKPHMMAQSTGSGIVHFYANIIDRSDKMSRREAYGLKGGHKDVKGNAILSVLPDTLLMLTENINSTLGKTSFATNNHQAGLTALSLISMDLTEMPTISSTTNPTPRSSNCHNICW